MTKKQLRRAIIKYQNKTGVNRCEQIRRTPSIVEGQANAK